MADLLTPDICVIGGGAGGIAVAEAALGYGASVVLVERDRVGGNRLYGGAVASKALLAAAARAHLMRGAAGFGIAAEARIQFRRVYEHVQDVVASTAPRDSEQRLSALGVTVVKADGRFADPRTLMAGDTAIRARRFVVATGSRPLLPDIPGLSTIPYFTSDSIFDNTRKLTHLLVVGAGPTGLELAQAYARLGTQVSVVDAATPLAGSDPELAAIVLRRLRAEGVDVRANTGVVHIQSRSQGIGVTVASEGREERLDISHLLVACGRRPNVETLELDKARVARAADGRLKLGRHLRTANPRIYATGDASGGEQSDQRARWQAERVVRHALFRLGGRDQQMLVPRALYTDPGLAEIGLTEAAIRRRPGRRFEILRAGFGENDRARAERETDGAVKLIVDPAGTLLGAGVAGPDAAELAALFSLAVANRLSMRHLAAFVAPYPAHAAIASTLAQAYAARQRSAPLMQRLLGINRLLP